MVNNNNKNTPCTLYNIRVTADFCLRRKRCETIITLSYQYKLFSAVNRCSHNNTFSWKTKWNVVKILDLMIQNHVSKIRVTITCYIVWTIGEQGRIKPKCLVITSFFEFADICWLFRGKSRDSILFFKAAIEIFVSNTVILCLRTHVLVARY
jgi:hypothetical protein